MRIANHLIYSFSHFLKHNSSFSNSLLLSRTIRFIRYRHLNKFQIQNSLKYLFLNLVRSFRSTLLIFFFQFNTSFFFQSYNIQRVILNDRHWRKLPLSIPGGGLKVIVAFYSTLAFTIHNFTKALLFMLLTLYFLHFLLHPIHFIEQF